MADTVATYTLFPEQKIGTSTLKSKRQCMRFVSRSDATGESNVVKIDISTLVGPNGAAPTRIAIDKIEGNISGMEVLLSFDRTTDTNAFRLSSTFDEVDFTSVGGFTDVGTGDTGDLLLSTNGHSAGDSYDITIWFRKKD
jgi:hypothetical protein